MGERLAPTVKVGENTFRCLSLSSLVPKRLRNSPSLTKPTQTPFAIVAFDEAEDPTQAAKDLVTRSILVQKIYELWGSGTDYESLHADIRARTEHLWPAYQTATFRFE